MSIQSAPRCLRVLGLVVLAAAASLGCSGPGDPRATSIPYPQACERYGFSERRCEAVVASGIAFARLEASAVATIDFIPDPNCGPQPDGTMILCARSGTVVAYLQLTLTDGSVQEQGVYCGVGSAYSLACTESPAIAVHDPVSGGYSDFPENAARLPEVDPEAAAAAEPLEVASLTVPIDHAGPYEVAVGRAKVPNGILTETRLELATPNALAVTTDPGGVWLQVRPADPTRPPFANKYERGWMEGVEIVEVYLVFDVIEFEPDAELAFRDLVVR